MARYEDGLIGLGQAVPAAIQGYYDMKHFQAREREDEAKLKADEENKRRQIFMDRLTLKKAGYIVPDNPDDLYSAALEVDPTYGREEKKQKRLQMADTLASLQAKGIDISSLGLDEESSEGLIKPGLLPAKPGGLIKLTPEAEEMRNLELKIKREQLNSAKSAKTKTPAIIKNQKEFSSRLGSILSEAEKVKALIKDDGTFELTGPHEKKLQQKLDSIAIDAAKLFDPESVARESEVAAFRKMLFEPGSMFTRNQTASETMDAFKSMIADRAKRQADLENMPEFSGQIDKLLGSRKSEEKPSWAK